jgi:hypothetical protein
MNELDKFYFNQFLISPEDSYRHLSKKLEIERSWDNKISIILNPAAQRIVILQY